MEYANILREKIKSKRLYYHGHCATHSGYRVRDWVDTNLLINDKNDLQEITDNFAKLSVCKKDCIYAGIGFKGLVLASSIAFKTHNKFPYLTPSYDEEFSGSHEQQFTDSGLEIIIFTDIIITGKIVHETISKYKLKNVSAIFCILHRKPSNDELCNNDFWKTYENSIYALNNDVEVELCEKKEDCLLGDCQNNKV